MKHRLALLSRVPFPLSRQPTTLSPSLHEPLSQSTRSEGSEGRRGDRDGAAGEQKEGEQLGSIAAMLYMQHSQQARIYLSTSGSKVAGKDTVGSAALLSVMSTVDIIGQKAPAPPPPLCSPPSPPPLVPSRAGAAGGDADADAAAYGG